MATSSTLSTSTPYRFSSGRFYSWEGVGSCPGTCTHVWHYAQGPSRLFPELERDTREKVDLGAGFDSVTGVIGFRGEFNRSLAVDGQAGTLLRCYREHQMSANGDFLKRNWSKVKQAYQPLLRLDPDQDGIMEGPQANTLDATWYGKISWTSSLYNAALRAGEQMANDMGDAEFKTLCAKVAEAGRKNIPAQLFNGEYFYSIVDPSHPKSINSGTGCEIDQVIGQSWGFQVGLARILPERETRTALSSLWRYNFSPDVGVWRAANPAGRNYAGKGDAGLIMCTFPKPDWNLKKAGGGQNPGFVGYFNECMSGFEHQVASHMISEGMVQEGFAITRAIHDRYHPSKRNPYNEIECGDYYSRAMASYGSFIAACGYEFHGPRGHIGFSPRLTPENFRSAFTAAEGWGTFTQKITGADLIAEIVPKWGQVRLQTVALTLPESVHGRSATVSVNGTPTPSTFSIVDKGILLSLTGETILSAGQKLEIRVA